MPALKQPAGRPQRRLEIGVFAPGKALRDGILVFLRRNGFQRAAEAVEKRLPAPAEHVTVFDADAALAHPEAATVAIFGPTSARGEEVAAAAFQDAAAFVAADKTTAALETAVTALEVAEARTQELLAGIQSVLATGRDALAAARWTGVKS